jgi:hypothetical protein
VCIGNSGTLKKKKTLEGEDGDDDHDGDDDGEAVATFVPP